MKTSFHRLLVALGLPLGFVSPAALRADTAMPAFGGSSLTIHGDTFQWQDPAIEDGIYHHDTYTASNGSAVTVTGLIASPNLATVAGSGIDGFLSGGTYGDLVQSGSTAVSLTFNGREYGSAAATTTFTVDLPNGQVTSSTTTTFSGAAGSFTAAANGDVSGSETGYVVNGTFYLNSTIASDASLTLPNGHVYTSYSYSTVYSKDGNGEVAATISETYSGGNGSFTIDASGAISGAESGFVVGGFWYVNGPVTSAINLMLPNGHVYTSSSHDAVYARDATGQVIDTGPPGSVSGVHGTFTVDASGVISGSEGGYYLGGTWYVNGSSSETINWTSPTDKVYTSKNVTTTYSLDGNGQVVATSSETYSGGADSFTVANGSISGSESGYVINGNWLMNSSSARPAGATMSLFGTLYTSTGGSEYTNYDSAGNASSGWSDDYHSADGGQVNVWSYHSGITFNSGMSGWDYYVGSFDSDVMTGSLVLAARSGPSLLPAQIWVNGSVLNWQSGAVEESGTVTDNYSGTNAQGAALTLSVTGQMREYDTNGASATVRINETEVGTLTKSGGLNVSGHDVQASDPNRSMPLFFSGAMLWVNGSEYPFSGGYEDVAGNRTDTYVAPGGGTLSLIGSTASPASATVQVVWNGEPHSGTAAFSGGASFEVGALDISTLPPGSPPALWAAGRFYLREANTNRYVCTVCTVGSGAEAVTYQLTLNGTDVAQLTLSGTSSGGTLGGAFDASQGGVFALLQNGSVLVPACPANADGTLRQSAEALPEQLPPAVMVSGAGVWPFIGTLAENNVAVACYANASAANSTEAGDGAGCLLKIDATSGGVALCHYIAGTTATGSYGLQTHLFQTGVQSSLPMPVYGVDPNANNLPWGLTAPADGPASFQVGGDLWRYTGAGANGAALYQGYYNGQQLTLGAAGAGGGRLVTVTDPVGGNTSGLLNDVRAGTRLNNGAMVYAGGMDGTRAPSTVNNNNLAALTGNLDIPGNLLTLGALNGDAAASGLTLQFSDTGDQALLSTMLGRSAVQWSWWRMNPLDSSATLPVMALDSAFGLVLYNPVGNGQAGVVLNPAEDGVSSLRGVLRVRPGGDIPMGVFQEGDPP